MERVFDNLLVRQGIRDIFKMSDMERFGNYLEYLKKKANPNNRINYAVIQLYKGHFYHQLANRSGRATTFPTSLKMPYAIIKSTSNYRIVQTKVGIIPVANRYAAGCSKISLVVGPRRLA